MHLLPDEQGWSERNEIIQGVYSSCPHQTMLRVHIPDAPLIEHMDKSVVRLAHNRIKLGGEYVAWDIVRIGNGQDFRRLSASYSSRHGLLLIGVSTTLFDTGRISAVNEYTNQAYEVDTHQNGSCPLVTI